MPQGAAVLARYCGIKRRHGMGVPVWIPGMRIEVKCDAVMSGGRAKTTGIYNWQGGD